MTRCRHDNFGVAILRRMLLGVDSRTYAVRVRVGRTGKVKVDYVEACQQRSISERKYKKKRSQG